MSLHHWLQCACILKAARLFVRIASALALAIAATVSLGTAAGAGNNRGHGAHAEIDTEHLFGFTEGSDIGAPGERELESDTTGRFRRRNGSYNAVESELEAKYTLSESLRIGPRVAVAYYDIAGVTDLENQRRGRFQALSLDVRYRLLDRERAPVGLTFIMVPQWGFADDVSGASARQYGAEFLIAADRELVRDRIFAAFNLLYAPGVTHVYGAEQTERESTLGLSLAMTGQVTRGLFIGAETRFLQRYDGTGLNRFAGQALYVGPTLYAQLGGSWFLSAALNLQAAGRATGTPGALDLTNFERYQARLQIGVSF